MKYLFLDIDGVLNGHEKQANGYCGINPQCVDRLNRVITETDCRIVISSAWRYMIGENMRLVGFENLLLTHGLAVVGRIVGRTRDDRNLSDKHERGKQIRDWLDSCHAAKGCRYAVVDDDDEVGIPESGHPFLQTDGNKGLTDADADTLIRLLNGDSK